MYATKAKTKETTAETICIYGPSKTAHEIMAQNSFEMSITWIVCSSLRLSRGNRQLNKLRVCTLFGLWRKKSSATKPLNNNHTKIRLFESYFHCWNHYRFEWDSIRPRLKNKKLAGKIMFVITLRIFILNTIFCKCVRVCVCRADQFVSVRKSFATN